VGILYVWSVISEGLMIELGWTSTQATRPFTVFGLCMATGFFIAGLVMDRLGPRVCILASGILMGVGLVVCGIFTTPWMVALGFGVICGAGVGMGNCASIAPPIKWFPDSKKGMASGIVLAGIGVSAVLYSPLSRHLMGAFGIANTFLILGATAFIAMYLLAFNMYDPPPGYDRERGMIALTAETAGAGNIQQSAAQSEGDVPTRDMLKTLNFYLMFAIFALSTSSGLMITGHAAKIALVQTGWGGGFLLVIVLNIFSAVGRFLGGVISDEIGRVNMLKLTFAAQALNMILFRYYTSVPLMVFGIMVTGFCFGTIFAVMPPLTADLYGLKHFGSNYGSVFLAWGIGGLLGPMTAAAAYDTAVQAGVAAGAYNMAYMIASGLSLSSLALVFCLRRPKTH